MGWFNQGIGNVGSTHLLYNAPLRIMPVGDSITDGTTGGQPGSWRIKLQTYVQSVLWMDYVGTLENGPTGAANTYWAFDREHEGHNGFQISGVTVGIPEWLSRRKPDLMIIIIGTNDGHLGRTLVQMQADLVSLCTQLQTYDHGWGTYLFGDPPLFTNDASVEAMFVQYRASISGLISPFGSRFNYTPTNTGMTPAMIIADGIHPNPVGMDLMADNLWNGFVKTFIGTP